MSQAAPLPARVKPRWSAAAHVAPLSIATVPGGSACVSVGPPLFASAPIPGFALMTSPVPLNRHWSGPRLLCVVSVLRPVPAQAPPVFTPTSVFDHVCAGPPAAGARR